MIFLNLFSILCGFVGSILLSAGLIKSKEQASDENAQYWGYNPYIGYQKYTIMAGFIFLIVGFSFQFALAIPSYRFQNPAIVITVLVGISMSLLGIILLEVYQKFAGYRHALKKRNLHRRNFPNSLRSLLTHLPAELDVNRAITMERQKNDLATYLPYLEEGISSSLQNELLPILQSHEKNGVITSVIESLMARHNIH